MSRYFAEFIGTFVLVFAGCGSAVLAGDKIGFAGVSLAFGLSLLAMVYTIGHVSGCHINPAVTLGLFISKKFERRYLVGYWVAQILGAIVAAACLLAIAKGTPNGYDPAAMGFAANGYGAHSPGQYGLAAAVLTEVILTFFLVLDGDRCNRSQSTGRLCRSPDWLCFGPDPFGGYSSDKYFRQPSTKYRASALCGRLGSAAALAVHTRTVSRLRSRRCGLP